MRRREFISLLGNATTWPFTAQGTADTPMAKFLEGLRKAGVQ